ncbi:MAG: precorrin-8X methylmutase, partial [Clostridia bacterium]|nr:precorrin-8X methylmutase [Clostridia bacterium]
MSVIIKPSEIERSSMGIIETELQERGITLDPEQESVVKRVIHTTADFDYADNLTFTAGAVGKGSAALANGACIITDTNMAKAGVSRPALSKLGG